MMQQQESPAPEGGGVSPMLSSPSFRDALRRDSPINGDDFYSIVDDNDNDDDEDDDFEFAFVIKDLASGPDITADEIFSNGRIRPIYPVFNRALLASDDDPDPADPPPEGQEKAEAEVRGTLRRLLFEERENSDSASSLTESSSGVDELEGIPPDTYCAWAPSSSPSLCKKSSSTGSSLRWRLRELVVGRSHSDGKDKIVFLAAEKGKKNPSCDAVASEATAAEKSKTSAKGRKSMEVDMATAHRIYYGRNGPSRSGAARRSFLPYKQDMVAFFAKVNRITRTHHPF